VTKPSHHPPTKPTQNAPKQSGAYVNINDIRFKALGDQGFTGSFNDRTLKWLKANGATSGNINDAWHQMLSAQGVASPFHVNDGWFQLLGNLGFTGSINDREYAFWSSGGSFGAVPPQVNGPPNQVDGVTVEPSNNCLIIGWDPQQVKPTAIYTIQVSLDQRSWSNVECGSVTKFNLSGLTSGTLYNVRVYATNDLGSGPLSETESGIPL
jgi:hypothetical protein